MSRWEEPKRQPVTHRLDAAAGIAVAALDLLGSVDPLHAEECVTLPLVARVASPADIERS